MQKYVDDVMMGVAPYLNEKEAGQEWSHASCVGLIVPGMELFSTLFFTTSVQDEL